MRFYRFGRRAQWLLTAFWVVLLLAYVAEIAWKRHLSWYLGLWLVLGVTQLSALWLDYWVVLDDGIAQHGILYRKFFAIRRLRYAGPVRRRRLQRWLAKAIEVEIADADAPRYVTVADRAGFMTALRSIAPSEAEIIG